ncbi:MAG: HugZ family protein [Pirellula sp.]
MTHSNDIVHEVREFVGHCKTVILSTVSAQGEPNASYAPFAEHQGAFYVLVSGLAKHTANLITTGQCHAMFIADEKDSVNVFARKRVSYTCEVSELPREDSVAKVVFDKMHEQFGPTIGMLVSLPDFRLVRLVPGQGVWVRGFAQAIQVRGF